MKKEDLLRFYHLRIDKYDKIINRYKRLISWLSVFRLLVFAGGISLSIIFYKISILAGTISMFSSIAVFAILLKYYAGITWKLRYNSNMLEVNRSEVRNINEDYSGSGGGLIYSDPSHDFSHDIDMFGSGSVFQSLNRCSTQRGEEKLASWLLNPYELIASMYERSKAIRELSDKTDWRHKFSSLGMMNLTSASETASFMKWMEEKPHFSNKIFYKIVLLVFPATTIILFLLWAFSLISIIWFTLMCLANLSLVSFNLVHLNRIHQKLTRKSSYLSVVSLLIEHIIDEKFEAEYLIKQQEGLEAEGRTAVDNVRRLSRIMNSFDSRLNMIMGVFLNGIFLWDYQCVIRMEKWKKNMADKVAVWFNIIAGVDAINSLAYFANNNPDFVYAEISDGSQFLKATKLGHHLIPSEKRVSNDYFLPGEGAINIITGANMAGKSTFLRTVAVNMVLGMAGAPVCADSFIFTPVHIFTSMRTSDSLTEEESYFFAELKRLRRLIDLLSTEKSTFFILDEILKGTNSKDKSEGSRAFIAKAIKMGGTGLIATHDISLGNMEQDYPEHVSNSCFEIEIENGDVSFDYILREGITSKMNAALLMKQQGII
jgi:hypothetical protein